MRVLGVWFLPMSADILLNAAFTVAFVLRSAATDGKAEALGISSIAVFVYPLVSLGLILFADRIARWLVPGDDTEIALAVDARTVHVLAFSVVGVVLIARGLPGVTNAFLFILMERETLQAISPQQSAGRFLLGSVPKIIQLLFGLLLFFRSDLMYRYWQRRQRAEE
jgi:uncharacterized membrane protein